MSITRRAVMLLGAMAFACMSGAQPKDTPDPERVIGQLLYGQPSHMGELWVERRELVKSDPTTYAPVIRERLMRLPATLDEYTVDDPRWVVNNAHRPPHGAVDRLMFLVSLLGREHAGPILQEFFDKVNPLALEATRRHWNAKDAALAAGRRTSEEWVRTSEVYQRLSGARSQAIKVAAQLNSDVLYDDFVAMLTSADTVAQTTGAAYTRGYLDEILERWPEATPQIVEAAARLSASEDARVAEAGRSLMQRVRQEIGAPDEPDAPAPEERDPQD